MRDRFECGFCCNVFDEKSTEEQQHWEKIEELLHVEIDLSDCNEGKFLYTSIPHFEVRTVMIRRGACVRACICVCACACACDESGRRSTYLSVEEPPFMNIKASL